MWKNRIPFEVRVSEMQRVRPESCWLWEGYTCEGYGVAHVAGRVQRVHRAAYELVIGPIQPGLHLDHTCQVRRCFNPTHLQPVTSGENSRLRAARRTHCRHGHPWTPENTRIILVGPKKSPAKWCNECGRMRSRRYVRERYGHTPRRPKGERTICFNGHEIDSVGIYTYDDGSTECMACRRAYSQRARDKKKGKHPIEPKHQL